MQNWLQLRIHQGHSDCFSVFYFGTALLWVNQVAVLKKKLWNVENIYDSNLTNIHTLCSLYTYLYSCGVITNFASNFSLFPLEIWMVI